MPGAVMTVLGPVSPDALGVTLPHEHVICDMARTMYTPSADPVERAAAEAPITLETLWRVHERPLEQRENLSLTEEAVAEGELAHYRAAGGGAIVDCTVRGLHPDPAALARLSRKTGVHVVLGTGYYVARTHPPDMDTRSVEAIADELVRDLTVGIGTTGVRAGLLGELGIGGRTAFDGVASFEDVGANELKVLRAAARAHHRTGVAISIHPPRSRVRGVPRSRIAGGALDLLDREGVPLDRVVVGHLDGSWDEDVLVHREIATRGAYVEYDVWGWNDLYWPARRDGFLHDARRVELVRGMVEAGLVERVLLAHDICTRHRLRRYGGHGYDYLLRVGREMLRANGVSEAAIRTMTIDNPARVLTVPAPAPAAPAAPDGGAGARR
jgi:phosphotriesterase-related protein